MNNTFCNYISAGKHNLILFRTQFLKLGKRKKFMVSDTYKCLRITSMLLLLSFHILVDNMFCASNRVQSQFKQAVCQF